MECVYWVIILVIEFAVFFLGGKGAVKATGKSFGSLQPADAALYALGVAVVMLGVGFAAYFIAYDLLGFKIQIISRKT